MVKTKRSIASIPKLRRKHHAVKAVCPIELIDYSMLSAAISSYQHRGDRLNQKTEEEQNKFLQAAEHFSNSTV